MSADRVAAPVVDVNEMISLAKAWGWNEVAGDIAALAEHLLAGEDESDERP